MHMADRKISRTDDLEEITAICSRKRYLSRKIVLIVLVHDLKTLILMAFWSLQGHTNLILSTMHAIK